MSRKMSFRGFSAVIVAILLIAGEPPVAGHAQSSSEFRSDGSAPSGSRVVLQMEPDCAQLTDQARKYAQEHNIQICGLNATISGGVTTQNTVAGACGTSTILLNKTGGGNTLSVNYGFYSTLGNAVLRSLAVSVGSTAGSSGGWVDLSPMNNYVYSTARLQTFPRHATALASLGGTITLVWGLVCYMKGPTASMYVS